MSLTFLPALDRLDLVADPVRSGLAALSPVQAARVEVAEIDPEVADTQAMSEAYGIGLDESANCVIVTGKRGGVLRHAAVLVLATHRADINNVVRRHLDCRKISFAPTAFATAETGMEYGGIGPVGLPDAWPVLVDGAVAAHPRVIIGSGLRRSKLFLPGSVIAGLPGAEVLDLAG